MQDNVIKFPEKYNGSIVGIPVEKPKTKEAYLDLCKQFLDPEDYKDILCGIMDKEHYDGLESPMQKIIDCYFSFGA